MRKPLLAAALIGGLLASVTALAEEPFGTSAHSEALHLVLTSQSEALKHLDPDAATLETRPRTWSVFRPAGSGVLDRANTFTVTLAIEGRVVASWYVNTGEGTVEPHALAPTPDSP